MRQYKIKNLTEQKFGRWIVIQLADRGKNGSIYWLCRCVCGKEKRVQYSHLQSGASRSCGCLSREISIQCNTKHGHNTRGKVSKTYKTWLSMIQRCTNPKSPDYYLYGGRGIRVCKRWLKFENFLDDMGERPTNNYTLDRISNNKGYSKINCHWATRKEQARNRRSNLLISFNGKTQCLIEWAEELGIKYGVLLSRSRGGWSINRMLTQPVGKYKRVSL